MGSLKQILENTVFSIAFPDAIELGKNESINVNEDTWIWEQIGDKPSEVKGLTCTYKTVLNTLEWKTPNITAGDAGKLDLPLTTEYILKKFRGNKGIVVNQPYQLDGKVESGLLIVFGYQYDLLSKKFKPIDKDGLDEDCFMPNAEEEPAKFESVTVSRDKKIQIMVRPWKVIYCIELLCNEPENDYEPTGAGNIARFYPRYYFMSSLPVSSFEGSVHLVRPKMSNHIHGDDETQDTSTHEYHNGFYTDSNDFHVLDDFPYPPKWPGFFSYYKHNVKGPFHVVKSDRHDERKYQEPIKIWRQSILPELNGGFEEWPVTKVPYQGAFDNIHIAPAMIAPAKIRKMLQKMNLAEEWKTLNEIQMAPICEHDCLHMHWRWGKGFNETRHTLGWDNNGGYKVPGATMIPKNQDLFVGCPETNEIMYTVQINDVPKNKWQICMDHGAGYVVSLNRVMNLTVQNIIGVNSFLIQTNLNSGFLDPVVNQMSWAMMYWNLRYVAVGKPPFNGAVERVQFDEDKLQGLIDC